MLYPDELPILIIWEEQEDTTEKVLMCCFPHCTHCKKMNQKRSFMPHSITLLVVAFKPHFVLTNTTSDFAALQDIILDLAVPKPRTSLFGKGLFARQRRKAPWHSPSGHQCYQSHEDDQGSGASPL